MAHVSFIYIACSRQVPPRRLSQSAPEIVSISSGGLYLHCEYKNSLLGRLGRQRGPRLPYVLMNAAHSRPWASTVRRLALQRKCTPPALVLVLRVPHGAFYPPRPRSEPCKMAQRQSHEYAPTQTSSIICCPLEAVDIECRRPRAEGLSKRAKKL